MTLQAPVLNDLSSVCKSPKWSWEVNILGEDSFFWSIIISYLLPVIHSENLDDLIQRLKNLTDNSSLSQDSMDELKNFNPFVEKLVKAKEGMFLDEKTMKVILRNTKKKIKYLGNTWVAASKTLNCDIILLSINSNNISVFYINSRRMRRLPFVDPHLLDSTDSITVYKHQNGSFGFGMPLDIAQSLQEKALTSILKKDTLLEEKNIEIKQAVHNSENFIISLLTSDVKNVIQIIFKSPLILEKLNYAGYNTNPLVKGRDGFSAFYFCIEPYDSQNLNILYDHVSNNFYRSDKSCREPDDEILKVLSDLKCAFKTDLGTLKGFSPLSYMTAIRYKGILRFNEYQTNVVQIIKKVREEEAQQKFLKAADEIVFAILREYLKYFFSHAVTNDEYIQFENYLLYNNYYENLDNYTCILLLDNLISIKNKAFSDLVTPLFLMMKSNNYFPHKEHNHVRSYSFNCASCTHRAIPFKHRMNFFKSLKAVFVKLQNGSAEEINSPVDMILKSVQNIPKDDYLLERFKLSLETAICVDVNCIEGVLTIFRSLQILGEVIATSITENFASSFLLSAHLPLSIENALLDIRNDLSKYKANKIANRLKLENQISLLKKIQYDLMIINQVLQPVFCCQQLRLKEYIIKLAKPLSKISEEELKNIATNRENWRLSHSDQFKLFAVNIFRFFKKVLYIPFPDNFDCKEYAQKIKRLQDGAEALSLIFSFKITFDDPVVKEDLTVAEQKTEKIIEKLKRFKPTDDDIKSLRDTFNKYVLLLKKVFNLEINTLTLNNEIECQNLIKFKEIMKKNTNIFVGNENSEVRTSISEFLRPSIEATKRLEILLMVGRLVPDMKQIFDRTYLPIKTRTKIEKTFLSNRDENLQILMSYENSERQALGNDHETSKKVLEMFAKKEYRTALLHHASSLGKKLRIKFLKLMSQKMEFFMQRVKLIKNIIKEDDNIMYLLKSERYINFFIHRRYVRESDVTLPLEMLLFDIMNIMYEHTSFKEIYEKDNGMFKKINLRHLLSHGNIVVYSLGALLDPGDLPSEFINKTLKLIHDEKYLSALQTFWIKFKPRTLKDILIIDPNSLDEERWNIYSVFLPMR